MQEKEIPNYDEEKTFLPYGDDEDERELNQCRDEYDPFQALQEEDLVDQEEQEELEQIPLS